MPRFHCFYTTQSTFTGTSNVSARPTTSACYSCVTPCLVPALLLRISAHPLSPQSEHRYSIRGPMNMTGPHTLTARVQRRQGRPISHTAFTQSEYHPPTPICESVDKTPDTLLCTAFTGIPLPARGKDGCRDPPCVIWQLREDRTGRRDVVRAPSWLRPEKGRQAQGRVRAALPYAGRCE
ncbi:hypothetical protein EDB84DRAFT_931677 [Lactarius hengduanensis]|nr:hypothetical protein EDB84DRAFT_931677 [Lactarius hengduanensis]